MAPITISVTGTSSINASPEIAVLFFQVKSHGPSQDTVSIEATTTANKLQKALKELQAANDSENAPVANLSTSSVRSGSEIPRDQYGNLNTRAERVYYSQIMFEIDFRDFVKLGEITGWLASHEHVEISHVDWRLTDETKRTLGSQARKLAIRDAIEKANDYAEVVGRGVVPVEINDMDSSGPPMMMRAERCMAMPPMGDSGDQREDLDLTPQNIDVTNSVQVNFKGE